MGGDTSSNQHKGPSNERVQGDQYSNWFHRDRLKGPHVLKLFPFDSVWDFRSTLTVWVPNGWFQSIPLLESTKPTRDELLLCLSSKERIDHRIILIMTLSNLFSFFSFQLSWKKHSISISHKISVIFTSLKELLEVIVLLHIDHLPWFTLIARHHHHSKSFCGWPSDTKTFVKLLLIISLCPSSC